jgi:hypothetical protein
MSIGNNSSFTQTEYHTNALPSETDTQFRDEADDSTIEEEILAKPPLSQILRILFALNGLTLSLNTLPLMYVVNTRVAIPLPYLPVYGALAFLPYSFKPMYGYLSHGTSRHILFITMLFGNSLSTFFLTLIPPGGIYPLFLTGFLIGITDAWAELTLGLTLIDHARHGSRNHQDYSTLASRFQAQAATSRNSGAFLGSFFTCLVFLGRRLLAPDEIQLSGDVADALFITTGLLQIIGALASFLYKDYFLHDNNISISYNSFQPLNQEDDVLAEMDEESALVDDESSFPSYSSDEENNDDLLDVLEEQRIPSYSNWILIGSIQFIIIAFALKDLIVDWTSQMAWNVIIFSLFFSIAIIVIAMHSYNWWQNSHRVGLFLILKHTIPSDTMVVASFFYSVFQSNPLQLQILSVISMGITTLSSWSYSKLWSKFSTDRAFLKIIAGTTILAAVASLSNTIMVKQSTKQFAFGVAVLVKSLTTFCGEWAFLPDVIIATTSLSVQKGENVPTSSTTNAVAADKETTKKISIEYGALISCIDFGDQLGSWLTGPIVAMFGLSRENGWNNLDHFVLLCSGASIASLGLLKLLDNRK